MEVTKMEGREENKEIKRPEIDSGIIEQLVNGYEQPLAMYAEGVTVLKKSQLTCGRLWISLGAGFLLVPGEQ